MAKVLTARSVTAAKPAAGKRLEIPDGGLVGLYLVVQASGSRSWAVRYRLAGKPAKLTLGAVLDERPGGSLPSVPIGAAMTLAEARAAGRAVLIQVAAGIDPAVAKAESEKAAEPVVVLTFGGLVDRFIDRYAKPRNRSWAETQRLLRSHGADWLKRDAASITRGQVRDKLAQIVDRGSPISANRFLAAVRKLYAWGLEQELIDTSPAAGIKPPSPERSRDRVLSDAELAAIWHGADACGHPFSAMLKLLLVTGQRRDEVASLRWSELDLDRQTWTLPASRAKNDQEHVVPLSPIAMGVIEAIPRIDNEGGFVFPARTGSGHWRGYGKAKERLDQASGVTGWVLHDLRRSMATHLARLGTRVEVIEALLNHVRAGLSPVARAYNRYSFQPEMRSALEVWAGHIEAVMAGSEQTPNP